MEEDLDTPPNVSEQAAEWFIRWHQGDLSVAERFDYVKWLKRSPTHIGEVLRICRLYSCLTGKSPLLFINEDTLRVASETREANTTRSPSVAARRSWRLEATISATLIGLAALLWWPNYLVETEAGEWQSLGLIDGSSVDAGPHTQLRHEFETGRRVIYLLRGEALFRVAEDPTRPFIVEAGATFIRSIGTKFGVQHLGEQVIVTVLEGSVVVTRPESSSMMVTVIAGEQVAASALWPAAVQRVDASRELAWADRQLVFEDTTVAEAVEDFNRRNRLQIEVDPALAARPVRGVFDAADPESFVRSLATDPHFVWHRTNDLLQVQLRSSENGTSAQSVKP